MRPRQWQVGQAFGAYTQLSVVKDVMNALQVRVRLSPLKSA